MLCSVSHRNLLVSIRLTQIYAIIRDYGSGGCPGVPVHGGIPIVFISIHGVVTQFVNVSFLCVPVHEDTTMVLVVIVVKHSG